LEHPHTLCCVLAKPSTKSYADLIEALKNHLKPEPILIAERFRFYCRNQAKDEDIAWYVAEL